MSIKYNSNNSVKSFINKLFNTIPSSEINNDELNKLWNTCIPEPGPESELANWSYKLDDINNTVNLTKFNNNNATKAIMYGSYRKGNKTYQTKLTSCANMFTNRCKLTSIEFKAGIDCSKLISMYQMFTATNSKYPMRLVSIIGLENLDVSGVTNMNMVFYMCTSLKELDLYTWNVSSVTNMNAMFANCTNLNFIKVSRAKWIINSKCITTNMFNGCGVSAVTYVD